MAADSEFSKIERFLKKENVSPLLVDVQNNADLTAITMQFNISGNMFVSAADYCNNDEFPRIDALTDVLQRKNANIFVTGLTTFLKLKGDKELVAELENILSMTTTGHVVVLTYQCKQYLDGIVKNDKRLSSRVAIINGAEAARPKLVFVDKSLTPPSTVIRLNGIHELADSIESESGDAIYVKTAKHRSSFPYSLFAIEDLSNAFDVLCRRDSATNALSEEDGTPEQWAHVQENFSTWTILLKDKFGNIDALDLFITQYMSFDAGKRWLYYIALKLYGANNNLYLNDAVKNCSGYKSFVRIIYRDILAMDHTDPQFQRAYSERKNILKAIGNPIAEVADFCAIVRSKEKDAIYYLTDNTDQEKEQVFYLLDKYGLEYQRDELVNILTVCYPDLALYLGQYRFKADMLTTYFQDYKYQKVINKILPAFEETVREQAVKREYNTLLQARSSLVESIDRTGAQTYFTDAMGVEYLAFIMAKCHVSEEYAKGTIRISFGKDNTGEEALAVANTLIDILRV